MTLINIALIISGIFSATVDDSIQIKEYWTSNDGEKIFQKLVIANNRRIDTLLVECKDSSINDESIKAICNDGKKSIIKIKHSSPEIMVLIHKQTSERKTAEKNTEKRIAEMRKSGKLTQWKHIRDKFGEYDYWEYKCIYSGKGYCISERIDESKAYFTIFSKSRKCFNDDARLVFLLKDGNVVEFTADANFRCDGITHTRDIEENEFSSEVVAIRIDDGINGIADFPVKNGKSTLSEINNLSNLRSIFITPSK